VDTDYNAHSLKAKTRRDKQMGNGFAWLIDWRLRSQNAAATIYRSLVLLAIGWALLLSPVRAQSASGTATNSVGLSQLKIDVWQTEQGLPMNTAQSIYQTRNGALWVGTAGGLAQFDGLRFTTFESSAGPEIAAGPIFGFMEDREGALWIGHSKGSARYRNGKFEPAFDEKLVEGRRVWAFAQAADGVVWAATENGLLRWEKGVTSRFQVADGLPTNRLRSLDFDRDGALWIGTTGGGLVSYANKKFSVMNPQNGFPHAEVRHVLADPEGGIWAATAGAGLVRIVGGKTTRYTPENGLPTDQLTYLARDKRGTLWIGTWGGGVSQLKDGRISSINAANGLAGDQIWSIHADQENSLWVGTWNGGLNRVSARVFGVIGKPEGLASDNARSVMRAKDGAMWASTAGGGVSRIEGNQITAFMQKDGLATDETSALFEDRDGAVWIGSYTGGIARLAQGKITRFGLNEGVPNVDVRVFAQDRAGTIWAGTNSGLAKFNGQRFEAVRAPGAPTEGISALLEDRNGTLWIGTTGKGLVRYSEGVFKTLTRSDGLVSNWILALYEDAQGTLWIGTNGEGMNRFRDGRMSGIRTSDGLWDGTTQVILEDREGHLWITCNRGFFRLTKSELNAFADGKIPKISSTWFGPGHALRSTTFASALQPAGAVDSNGHLWLPSLKGLVIVDPARLPGFGEPPNVGVDQVTVNGAIQSASERVVLPPGSSPLSIRYGAATLMNAAFVQYRYQLEGITPQWVEMGKNREISFPTLPHGTYQFRVASSLDGKRWQESATPTTITVQPHFYQMPWFLALASIAAIGSAFGLYRLRTHQLRQRNEEMERTVEEKTEALRKANEHLSKLSFADALTGLANRRRLDETLELEWRRAARQQSSLAVIIVDIDEFKAYNDALGHPEGDKCLVAVAEVIRDAANRAGDFAARYGGEEFLIIAPGSDHAAATSHAEMIRRACETRAIVHPASRVGAVVTISVGVAACVPSEASSIATLIAAADAALYRAKREGRNRVR
jgi:diguanylate cyclase (GGDEF)-like protein